MNEVLSIEEIRSRFDSEWVLLEDPKLDDQMQVTGGRVVCHSMDRDEVDRKAVELRLRHSAFLHTGEMPENTAIIL